MGEVERTFELVAKMRDLAASNAMEAERSVEVAQAKLGELAAQPTLSAEVRGHLEQSVEKMLALARTQLGNIAKQLDTGRQVIETIDPQQPEHVGIVVAEVDAMTSLAATLQAQGAIMNLAQETQRRLSG